MPSKTLYQSRAGFTLIEMVLVFLLVAILAATSITVITPSIDEAKFNATVEKLQSIRDGMIGKTQLMENGSRVSFGFLGDIGALPSNAEGIAALTSIGSFPAYYVDTTLRTAGGWNGPYLVTGQSGVDYTVDGWGNSLTYDATTSPPILKSLGKDNAVGGTGFDSDIEIEIPTELTEGIVDGFLSNSNGTTYTGAAEVEITAPVAGVLTTSSLYSVSVDGHFQFTGIPFGVRAINVYKNTKAAPTATLAGIQITVDRPNVLVNGDDLRFP